MPYDFVVDQERRYLWVRYSGMVTFDERCAVAQHIVEEVTGPEQQRILLDYRRATSSSTDDASATALADYLVDKLGDRVLRLAWLLVYDHQLDATVEAKAHVLGIPSRRFREMDEALAWLLDPEPVADTSVGGTAAASAAAAREPAGAVASAGASLGAHMALGTSYPARRARGTFEVKVAPQSPDNPPVQAAALARLSLDKRYSGPLDAIGKGEMLAEGGGARKDGAYVAMERVTGKLHDREGSFALVHRALMRDGTPQDWTVVVVPGSGTDALAGIEGSLRITIEQGTHLYDFEYTLPG